MAYRLRRSLTFVLFCAAALAAAPATAAEAAAAREAASEARLRRDVTFLASDECEGRGPATRGLDLAADYVAAELKKAGLKPAGADGTWFQPFTLPAAILEGPARLVLEGPLGQHVELRQGAQFHPMGLGRAGKAAAAPLVFAGYGITSTGKREYDDYAGLDVEGKVVVLLRGAPLGANNAVAPELWQFAPFVRKLENAAKHKAAAVLIVNDADTARDGDHLVDFNYTALEGAPGKLPAFHLKRAVLEAMLPGGADGLRETERAIDRDLRPHSRELTGWSADLSVRMRRGEVTLKNVVGTLEGAPLAGEAVVVGAHYDHLGYGGAGGSRSRNRKMEVHHGADDNGSGTTALMELARRFGALKGREGRRLVFVAFSGEELGLFGSKHYCKEPAFPLADTAAMVNLDMVGRLRADDKSGKDKLLVEGNATGKTFDALVDDLNRKYDFALQKSAALAPNSDHFSFYQKKVPVLFFWTGYHPDYHMPSDTADKINVPGMRRVVDLAQDAVAELAAVKKRPEYVAVKIAGSGGSPTGGPRLGVMPAYTAGGEGMLLEEVVDGGPAARSGLKAGDRIVGVGDKPVQNVQTYMQAMGAQKKGATIDVHVLRDGKKQTIKVKLD